MEPSPSWPDDRRCPCDTGLVYGECCARRHRGEAAPTAESLMRSRYTAFVVGDADYLRDTWDASTRPATIELDQRWRWRRLEIIATSAGGPFDDTGEVEFVAHFAVDGERQQQHERSRFRRRGGRWYYLDEV